MSHGFSRRRLLKSAAVVIPAVAAPLLRASPLLAAPPPKRLIVLFKANGTVVDAFKPTGTANAWNIPAGGILEPLAPFKAKLNVLWGVGYDSADRFVDAAAHQKGPAAMLTGGGCLTGSFGGGNGNSSGYANHISIDQYLAQKWGPVTRLKTVELGVAIGSANNRNRISYLGSNQPVAPESNPGKAFARILAGVVPAASDAGAREQAARVLAARKSVLDFVNADLGRLSARLPGDERARLQQHLQSLRDLERQLGGGGAGEGSTMCAPGAAPNASDYPATSKAMLDLAFQTFACDQSRLITFLWNGETSQQTFPWLNINDPHHEMSHQPDNDNATRGKLIKVNRWYAEQVAYLLGKLDSVKEGNGKSMLDNSVVWWTDGLGKGNTHSRKNVPMVLAGSAGGHFPTGRFLDFGGKPHNHLLVDLLRAMGLGNETSFGPAPLNGVVGGLPGLAG